MKGVINDRIDKIIAQLLLERDKKSNLIIRESYACTILTSLQF